MLSIAAKVRAMIKSFGVNIAFTTGQLLGCGNRKAIDVELCRLVKKGLIKRLAYGMFIQITAAIKIPGSFEIAKLKASRFGKWIDPAAETHRDNVYHTNGCKSSFKTVYGRIQFKHIAPRKLSMIALIRNSCSATVSEPVNHSNGSGYTSEDRVSENGDAGTNSFIHGNKRAIKLLLNLLTIFLMRPDLQKRKKILVHSRAILR